MPLPRERSEGVVRACKYLGVKHHQAETWIGTRVRIELSDGDTNVEGTLVADYGDEIAALGPDVGRRWARPQRYGVALDDGRLVFTDTVVWSD